jgi:hypothetical protein
MAQSPVTAQVQLGTSASAVLTAGAAERIYVSKVIACNTSGSDRTMSWWLVPPSQSATNARALMLSRTIRGAQPFATEDVRELAGLVLDAGWALHGSASASASVTVTVQGVSIT